LANAINDGAAGMNDLDAEELFYLAMKASDEGNREKTISLLKQSIAREPQANALYILGAEYAELGMNKRAIDLISRALTLDPSLETARFQLGLLYMANSLLADARTAFEPLLELETDAYLYQFAFGMSHLLDDDADAAIACLQQGIELNQENEALNRDMRNVIAEVKSINQADLTNDDFYSEAMTAIKAAPKPTAEKPRASAADRTHLLVSKYGESEGKA